MPIRFLGGDTGDGGSTRLYQEGDDYPLARGNRNLQPKLQAARRAHGRDGVRECRWLHCSQGNAQADRLSG
jgi:hypothetical protein